jgi:hypothetical protein
MKRKTRMFSPQSFAQVSFALAALCLMPLFLSVKAQNLSSPKTTLIYSISDLEVLQQANAYQEFFKHAHDILPTQRTKYWLNMVSNMAQGFIDLSVKQDNFESSTFKVVERLSSWPELRGDEFYQIKRNRYALNYFKVCLSTQKTNHCKKRMLSFWKTARKEAETGFRLLQYFAGFFPSHDSWPLLKDILTKGDGQFYCDKPLVTSITFSHLEKQHLYSDSSERIKMYLSQMASAACWKKMAVRARQHLKEAPVSETRSLFVALENTTELTPTLKNTWLVRYYLSEPAPGSLLNRAWNQLELLSNDYAKRRNFNIVAGHSDLFLRLSFEESRAASEYIMDSFVNGNYDRVELVYNSFKNVATQMVMEEQFLPVEKVTPGEGESEASKTDYLFEPSPAYIVEELIPQSLKIQLYKALLDSNASEHGARMTAMDKATENAGELLKQLKLTYNRTRQAAITKEILEIVGGAEALAAK